MRELIKMLEKELEQNVQALKNKYWDIYTLNDNIDQETQKRYSKGEVSREYICNLCSKKMAEKEATLYTNSIKKINELSKVPDFEHCYLEIRTMKVAGKNEPEINVKVIAGDEIYEDTGNRNFIEHTVLSCLLKYKPFEKALYCYANKLAKDLQVTQNIHGEEALIYFYNYTLCIYPDEPTEEQICRLLRKIGVNVVNSDAEDCFRYALNKIIFR